MTAYFDEHLLTVRDWMRFAASRFAQADLYFGHGTDNAHDEAVQLVLDSLSLDPDKAELFLDACLIDSEREMLAEGIQRRIEQRMPLPYITGKAWFAGLPFRVTTDVLIPRSPIAEVLANDCQPWRGEVEVDSVLDLCAGSGCIGIVAALHYPEAKVDLAELSPAAVAVAETNIADFALQERVTAYTSDLFEALGTQQYSLILANPPYVDAEDMAALPAEYLHEPRAALASGDDGLDLTARILQQAPDYLQPGGLLILEVGNSQQHFQQRFPQLTPTWVDLLSGGHGVMVISREELVAQSAAIV